MDTIQQSFAINFQYDILFSRHIFQTDNPTLASLIGQGPAGRSPKVAFVVDQGCLDHHPALQRQIQAYFGHFAGQFDLCAPILVVAGGEAAKNSTQGLRQVLLAIDQLKIDRHAYLVAVGGGAVLDMVGFAAAIGHRGIRHIRIPTTVLSQNDSGVGVKNGINFFGKKNFIGAFAPPWAVVNDSAFLTTLCDRDWRAGIAEAVKVALIKDRPFFDWIRANASLLGTRHLPTMEYLVHRCAHWHAHHIANSGDPFEQGSSRPLDFGHWAAHKLEHLTDYALRHGEAVAIGIALDVAYAHVAGMLSAPAFHAVVDCLLGLGFDIAHPLLLADDAPAINPLLWDGLEEFREHLGGQLTIMLISGLGTGQEVHHIDRARLGQAAQMLFQIPAAHANPAQ